MSMQAFCLALPSSSYKKVPRFDDRRCAPILRFDIPQLPISMIHHPLPHAFTHSLTDIQPHFRFPPISASSPPAIRLYVYSYSRQLHSKLQFTSIHFANLSPFCKIINYSDPLHVCSPNSSPIDVRDHSAATTPPSTQPLLNGLLFSLCRQRYIPIIA